MPINIYQNKTLKIGITTIVTTASNLDLGSNTKGV